MKDINWKTVFSLVSGQALFQTATVLVSTLSGLVGLMLAPDKSYATLPVAVISIGTASMMIPAALLMKRFGKKFGFLTGISFGFVTGLLAAFAIYISSFWLFIFANLMIG